MKTNTQATLYFSAYPLKALKQENSPPSSTSQSPYLKAILSNKTGTVSRVRVLPMISPYRPSLRAIAKESKLPNDVELTQREWFNNYE